MNANKPVNSIVRTLQLIRAMNLQPVSSLDSLHKQTLIPKSSIIRLLKTLQSEGLVHKSQKYGSYYLTYEVTALSSGYHSSPRIVEASSKLADQLTEELKWPVSIAVPSDQHMVVRYSTIPKSPLSFFHSTINMRLSFSSQAMGQAFLAFIDEKERKIIIDSLIKSPSLEEDRLFDNPGELESILTNVRSRGYALRDPRIRPESSTIAIPIYEENRVVATIGLTWFSSSISHLKATDLFLTPLLSTSELISRNLISIPKFI